MFSFVNSARDLTEIPCIPRAETFCAITVIAHHPITAAVLAEQSSHRALYAKQSSEHPPAPTHRLYQQPQPSPVSLKPLEAGYTRSESQTPPIPASSAAFRAPGLSPAPSLTRRKVSEPRTAVTSQDSVPTECSCRGRRSRE